MNDLQHDEAAWRHKADTLIGAAVTDRTYSKDYKSEQLWAKKIDEGLYELCCIPFAIYDIFLGDIVRVSEDLEVEGVVQSSGHSGFRIATENTKDQNEIADELHSKGHLTERFSPRLLAVDAQDEDAAHEISQILTAAERDGSIIQFETIKT